MAGIVVISNRVQTVVPVTRCNKIIR